MSSQPLRVLIVGFYGVMNAGDDLLESALCHRLRDHRLSFSNQLPPLDIVHQFDLLVIGGGSLWPQHQFFQLGDRYARRLRIPFIVAGVSARSYDAQAAAKTRALVEQAAFFHVRDRQTATWIDHPKVAVGADLFWSAPWCGDAEAELPAPAGGVAIALRSDEMARWQGEVVDAAVHTLGGPAHAWPFYYGHSRHDRGGLSDFSALQARYGNAPTSFSLQPLRRSRVALTMRYHGMLCALRAGRPVIVADVHNKLRQFCEDRGLQDWLASEPAQLPDVATRLAANYEPARQQVLALRQQLLAEGEELAAALDQALAGIEPRVRRGPRRWAVAGLKAALSRLL